MKKIIFAALFVFIISGTALYARDVTVKGSDTLVILAGRWAEVYMKTHPGKTVQVTGGGSGTGIAALINGTTDICNASRDMKAKEKVMAEKKRGRKVVEFKVAKDGLAVFVHASNPVKELTMGQIKLIYTGKINNWREVGGPNAAIIRYSRENNSGTYVFFKEHVLGNENYAPDAQHMPGTAAVVNAVSKDKFSIGYGGMAYGHGIKFIAVKKTAASRGVLPSETTVKNDTYPVSRYLYQYTVGQPTGDVKKFIDWELSREGQKIVADVGYFPVGK